MSPGRALAGIAKLLLVSFAFAGGISLGGMVAVLLGLPPPAVPEGTDQGTLGLYLLLESPILALTLAFLSRGLRVSFLSRFLTLSLFTWTAYTLNTFIEASIFTTYTAVSQFLLVMDLVACLLCGAAAAWAFPPGSRTEGAGMALRGFFAGRRPIQWTWRLGLALVAFAAIYLFFGSLVAPYTIEYYRQQAYGLTLPCWEQIVPVLCLRSLLFLVACLPVLVAWRDTPRRLILTLGAALFVTVGLLYLLLAYWLPPTVRLLHGLEILADSFVYAWALVTLLGRQPTIEVAERSTATDERAADGRASYHMHLSSKGIRR